MDESLVNLWRSPFVCCSRRSADEQNPPKNIFQMKTWKHTSLRCGFEWARHTQAKCVSGGSASQLLVVLSETYQRNPHLLTSCPLTPDQDPVTLSVFVQMLWLFLCQSRCGVHTSCQGAERNGREAKISQRNSSKINFSADCTELSHKIWCCWASDVLWKLVRYVSSQQCGF